MRAGAFPAKKRCDDQTRPRLTVPRLHRIGGAQIHTTMKTHPTPCPEMPSETALFDALLLIVAGAAFEAQTRGAVKPFGKQRLTLRALAARLAGAH